MNFKKYESNTEVYIDILLDDCFIVFVVKVSIECFIGVVDAVVVVVVIVVVSVVVAVNRS